MTLGLTYRLKDLKLLESGLEVRVGFPKEFLERELGPSGIDVARSEAGFFGQIRFLLEDQVECVGTLTATFGLSCHRCLEPTSMIERVDIHAMFIPQNKTEDGVEVDDSFDVDGAVDVFYHHGEVVELEPMLREHLVLALPLKVLCKEDCLGLCPVCGENKNLVPCGCKERSGFSPFEKLKELLR